MSEDPWDNWETAADAGLIDCKIPKKAIPPKKQITNNELWEKANQFSSPIIIHTNNDAGRTEFKPELKILKRPDSVKCSARDGAIQKKPIKGLAERERDYEEAKRKINEKFNNSSANK